MRILIVEDEAVIAVAFEWILRAGGHDVVAIADDAASAAAAARLCPDIALVDLNLRDGPTGAAIGRGLAALFGVTVVYLTANPDDIGDPAGALGIVTKPCDGDDIARVVDFAARRRSGERHQSPPRPLHLVG